MMEFKKKTKAAQVLTGILTLCIILAASFAGGDPVSAAVGSGSAAAGRQLASKKNGSIVSGTYIYDADWDDDEEQEDQELFKEYAAHGIERKGGAFYYKGKRVKVVKEQDPDGSVYRFDSKLKGTISIKVVRNAKGKIKRITYLTKKEAARLIRRAGLKE